MIRHAVSRIPTLAGAVLLAGLVACQPVAATDDIGRLPAPIVDASPATAGHDQVAVLAGGCFWGVAAVFERVKGVRKVTAGYSGGSATTAHYAAVGTGTTGHAESVQIEFDPSQVSYGTLLQVFFSVALNPTELNRQGPDRGTQYHSVILYANVEQKKIASDYIAQLTKAKAFAAPIVTEVVPLKTFYPAEAWHQHYYDLHPNNPYIVVNDMPKVVHLQKLFPTLYRDKPPLVEMEPH